MTALIGPRQCGKTTLARQLAAQKPHEYFDLEAPSDLERLAHPMTALQPARLTP
ncbi:MAG: AAA family ATPase [Verrucomicrobia bacterium]|nr:AAA family ATPase [Verrucomicrobiota bacterium]